MLNKNEAATRAIDMYKNIYMYTCIYTSTKLVWFSASPDVVSKNARDTTGEIYNELPQSHCYRDTF